MKHVKSKLPRRRKNGEAVVRITGDGVVYHVIVPLADAGRAITMLMGKETATADFRDR